VALAGSRAAGQPPDREHPYGHRKFETMAAVGIMTLLALVLAEVARTAITRLASGFRAEVRPAGFVVMLVTLAINLVVVAYERREGNRLSSEVLLADALHTRSDVLTSIAVIAALVGARAGYPIFDPLAALVVAGFIGYAIYEIARSAISILGDRIVFAEDDLRKVIVSVPGVLGCHQIRSRGSADHVFLDLHIWLEGSMRLDEAHAVSHTVKDRLMAHYPQIADAVIHLEPPPKNSS
jgi:cation diffusion facilitator family transporter